MAYEKPLLDVSLPVAADYSAKQYYAMKVNGSTQLAIATTAGERVLGILQDDPDAAGQVGLCRTHGISKAIAGGTITVYDQLTTDANGKLVTAGENDENIIGVALEGASSNEVFTVLLMQATGMQKHGWALGIPITLAQIASDGDVLTTWTPGFAGTIEKVSFAVTVVVTTASKAADLNIEIGTTDVTGGVVGLTSANCTPLGAVIEGTEITADNEFTASDTISIKASSVTAFIEGEGVLLISFK